MGNGISVIEPLEARRLLAAVGPSADEQLLIELINRARADPVAEATRLGIDLNEGLSPGTISPAAKQPLAVNPYLVDAARGHSRHMLDVDAFAHDSIGDGTPSQRIAAAGYVITPPGGSGENIAWKGNTAVAPDPTDTTVELHEALFVDVGIADRGHRTNMLYANYREVGTGVIDGIFSKDGYNYRSIMLSEEFAYSAGNHFLTGVVYADTVTTDRFYTPGEGLGGVSITATNLLTHATFTTSTWTAGGYSLQLPDGRYRVTANGQGVKRVIRVVSIAGQNQKRDFQPGGADVGIVRNAHFFLDTNGNHTMDVQDTVFAFGLPTDVPIVGDWNGDGTMKAGIFRDGIFALDVNGSGTWDAGDAAFSFGIAGDRPIVGDWNGDGLDDIGIHRGAVFALDADGSRTWSSSDVAFNFGIAGDVPIAGDWSGDGYAKIGIVRDAVFAMDFNGNRQWDAQDRAIAFGIVGDVPVIGDWMRDGIARIGIRRGNLFALDRDGSGTWDAQDQAFAYGVADDWPVSL